MWEARTQIREDRIKLMVFNKDTGADVVIDFNARDKDKAKEMLIQKLLVEREKQIKGQRIINSLGLDTLDQELEKRSGKI